MERWPLSRAVGIALCVELREFLTDVRIIGVVSEDALQILPGHPFLSLCEVVLGPLCESQVSDRRLP